MPQRNSDTWIYDSRLRRRARLAASMVLILLATVSGAAFAQERAFDGWDTIVDPSYRHDPDRSDVATFAVQNTAGARVKVDAALSALRAGDFIRACDPLQTLVNLYPTNLYQVSEHPAARYVGAAEYAKFLLGSFPPEARDEYTAFARLRSSSLWRAIADDLTPLKLEKFVRSFELTPEGKLALERLGRLAIERGDFESAAIHFGRRLAWLDEDDPRGAEIGFLAATASSLAGDDGRANRLVERFADSTVRIAGEERAFKDALDQVRKSIRRAPAAWPVLGGDNSHSAKPPFDTAALTFQSRWEAEAFTSDLNPWRRTRSTRESFPFHPVVGDDVIVLNDGLSVRAWSFYSANPKWSYEGPIAKRPQDRSLTFEDFVLDPGGRADSEFGAIARSLQYSAVIANGMVVAPMLESLSPTREIEFDQTRITTKIPKRALHALDLSTGALVWKQRRDDRPLQDFINRVSIGAAPIVIGDRVYVAGYVLEGAINVYVLCLDLATGDLLWRTPLVIGQQELTMFNKSFKEFTLQMLAASEGCLYVCTNLGLVASLDALSGAPRWMAQYDSLPIRGSNHYRRTSERPRLWINDPPIVKDGVVVVTPLDSEYAFAFDAATGARLWRVASDEGHPLEYCSLLGVDQGAVVFGGLNGIGFYDLHKGSRLALQRYRETRTYAGRGVVADGVVYQPLVDGLYEARFENGAAGVRVEDRLLDWQNDEPGNLVLYRDFQIVVSSTRMTVFYDLDDLIARVRARVDAGVATAADHIDLGELLHLRGDALLALPEFERVLAMSDVSPLDVRRARERAANAHRTLADLAAAGNDVASEVKHRFAEADYSVDDFSFLRTCESLIRTLEAVDPSRIEAVLEKIDARCPGAVFPFSGALYGMPIPAGLFTLDRRAIYALGRREPKEAVRSWQKMLENYREHPLSGTDAGDYAARMIADAIAKWGREIYAEFDEAARAARTLAIETRNPTAMTEVIERYPNATTTTATRLDLARLRLERGEYSEVFEALGPLLTGAAAEEDRQNALLLVGRGARAAGDSALAHLIFTRLARSAQGIEYRFEPGSSLADIAARDLAGLGSTTISPTATPLLARLPDIGVMGKVEIPGARAVLVQVRFETDDAALVYVEGGTFGADAELQRIDARDGKVIWKASVPAYASDFDPLVAFSIGDRLIFRQRDRVFGFDRATGAIRFETRLESNPMSVVSTGGLVFVLLTPMQQGASTVVALETATGRALWRRSLTFSCRMLRVTEDAVVAVGDGGDPSVGVFDALTGAERFSISNLALKLFEARPFPEQGVLLVTGRQASKRLLSAFDLSDGRPLWRDVEAPYSMTLDWFVPDGDSLLLPVGTSRAPITHSARGISELRRLWPRKGEFETVLDGLESLRAFDSGSGLLDGRMIFVASDGGSRKSRNDRLVICDFAEARVTKASELGALPKVLTVYSVFPTANGDLVGVIETKRGASSPERLFLFTFSTADEAIGLNEVREVLEGAATSVAVTPGHLVLLRGSTMYLIPVR